MSRGHATRVRAAGLLLAAGVATALVSASGGGVAAAPAKGAATKPPPVRHVFVINLENKGYDETFGPTRRRRTSRRHCATRASS